MSNVIGWFSIIYALLSFNAVRMFPNSVSSNAFRLSIALCLIAAAICFK